MSRPPKISIVIPVFESEPTLSTLYARIDSTVSKIDPDYELIFVEDGGEDGSWSRLKMLWKDDPRHVRIVRFSRNYGQHNALLCGFSFALGRYIITLDDDLQNPPEEIPKMVNAMEASEFDVVYGLPENRKHTFARNLGSLFFMRLISKIFGMNKRFAMSSFRIIRKETVDHLLKYATPNPVIGPLLLKITDRIGSVTVEHHPRFHGESTYTTRKLIRHFLNGILYHSDLPLKAVFFLGIGCLILSLGLGLFYFARYLMGAIGVSGWTTLVLLVLFFSGIGMFSLGIIGEYLLRIIQEAKRGPQYIIREKETTTETTDGH